MGWAIASCLLCFLAGYFVRDLLPVAVRRHDEWRRRLWARKSRHKGGRPAKDRELVSLIYAMKDANPTWGAPRIHGELKKLGYGIAQSTVSKYLRR